MADPIEAEIILYRSEGANVPVQVRYMDETLWMPQKEIAELFGKDKSTISRHMKNIFEEGELDRGSVVAEIATTASDGKRYRVEFYSLDAIIAVGYLMREAQGYELSRSVFQPRLFRNRFPQWNKLDTILLCITILNKIKYLNEKGVILGDINPGNILVVSSKEVYFVDCDSYQVGNHPCPVGTANFTPPEIQKKDYKTFLRTQAMENFAIATLLFMIMLPGKPPYSAVGGETPEKNIRKGEFPYPLEDDTDKTPPGKWGFMWSQMSYKTKEAFWNTFHKDGKYFRPEKRLDAAEWLEVFETYRKSIPNMMQNDPMANEISPTRMKGDYEVEERVCEACGKPFPITQKVKNWEKKKSEAEGHPVRNTICPNCKQSSAKRSVTSYTKPAAKYVAQKTRSTTSAATTAPKNNSASNRQSYAQKTIGIPSKITGAQRKQTAAKATSTVGSAQTTGENKEENFTSKVMLPVFAGCYIVALVYCLVEYGIEFFTYLFPLGLILGLIGVGMVAVFPAGIILGILYVLEAIIVAITKKKP